MKKERDILIVLALALVLNLLGITWGIPRQEHRDFYYSDHEEFEKLTSGISREYVERSWDISKGEDEIDVLERSRFNIMRSFHPDEHNIIKSISNMNPRKLNFNPYFFEYPSFFIYLFAILLGIFSLFNIVTLVPDIAYYFLNPGEIGKFYIIGRAAVVIFSLGGVYFINKTAQNFFDRRTAFFSALFLAVAPLYVINSHYLTVDIPMVSLIIFSLYPLSVFWKNGDIRFLYTSAIFLGLSAGTKYPAFFLWFMLPMVYALRKERFWALFSSKVIKSFFITAAVFFVTTPYSILAFDTFKRDLLYQFMARGFGFSGISVYERAAEFLANTHVALLSGLSTLYLLFLVSLVYVIIKRGVTVIVLAGLFLSLLPLLMTGGLKYARYYLMMMPFAALITGLFLSYALEKLRSAGKNSVFLTTGIISLFFVFPVIKSLSYSLHMQAREARISSARYIEENIPAGSEILFTSDPWTFEVPPVNRFTYNTSVVSHDQISSAEEGSYLVLGELQYFLYYGSRQAVFDEIVDNTLKSGYNLEALFQESPRFFGIEFDKDITVHDMVYSHPTIFIFKKK